MPEHLLKIPQPESPVARSGAGDISERELSRERHNLQTSTPPARVQPAHPRKQLCSAPAPVSKFTGVCAAPGPHLARLRSCLDQYRGQGTPARPRNVVPKAVSMEDLTPTKRIKREKSNLPPLRSPCAGPGERAAAARIGRFMLTAAWRRRRDEVRCLRKTLEFQVGCSERLRLQVCALKSLLDSDNAKVRLAMRELERLKQLLRDKDLEKAVLEREKLALENDVCAAEDKASEMSIGWRNCRNELDGVRAASAASELALAMERAAAAEARNQRDHAYSRLSQLEQELAQHEQLLSTAESDAAALRRDAERRQRELERAAHQLRQEKKARERCARECSALGARAAAAAEESGALRGAVGELRAEVARLGAALRDTQRQLDWWPRPLTKMLGAARSWLRYPVSLPEAVLWTLVPARHGC